MDKLLITTQAREKYVLLTLKGILDSESCPQLGRLLQGFIDANYFFFVLDLFGLTASPSLEFKTLMDQITKRIQVESKGFIIFVRPSPVHYADMKRNGLLTNFMWFVDPGDAIDYINYINKTNQIPILTVSEDEITISPSGRLTLAKKDSLRARFEQAVAMTVVPKVVLDLENVTYISDDCFMVLIWANKQLTDSGRCLVLINTPESLAEKINMTFGEVFRCE